MTTLFHRNERGATAVLVAGSLFLLMGVAAVSIDWGSATNQQRQDQTAADLGSIAAVQFATGTTKAAAINAGALAAMQVVEATIGLGTLDWNSCAPNPLVPSNASLSPNSCISFTDNLRKARVIVPPIDVNAPFGNVIGLGTIETTAASVAGAESAVGGKVLPFGLPGASAGDTEICLRTVNNANGTGPCTKNQQGNFGTLDVTLFGDADFGTKKTCTGQTQNLLAVNMALGGDHPLGIHSEFGGSAPGDIEDGATCNSNNSFLARPNIIEGQTGQGSALYPGMIEGSNSSQMLLNPPVPGRLVRGSNKIVVDSSSPSIDNTGLWNYIRSDKDDLLNVSLPGSCRGTILTHAQMATCIADWRAGVGGPFDYLFRERDGSLPYIGDATRFAAVPVLGDPSQQWGNGTQSYKISNIIPIYIQGTYWDCNNNGCEIAHFPGETNSSSCSGWSVTTCGVGSNGKKKLTALTGFILDKSMLPPSLSNSWPDTETGIAIDLVG